MKKLIVFFVIIILTVSSCISVFAAEKSRIVDNEDLLSDAEEQELLSYINKVSDKYDFELVIVTTDSLQGKTPTQFADDFFDYNGYGYGSKRDGALLMFSKEQRVWAVSTSGKGLRVFDDGVLDSIENTSITEFAEGNYYNTCKTFIEISEDTLAFPLAANIVISLIVGFVIAFILVGVMKKQLNSVQMQIGANVYTKPGSMNVTLSKDFFLYSLITRRPRPKSNNGSHTSSSGRRHGGRSGSI